MELGSSACGRTFCVNVWRNKWHNLIPENIRHRDEWMSKKLIVLRMRQKLCRAVFWWKMMENALDTLKTAFPHPESLSPTEDIDADADGRTMDNRKYRLELHQCDTVVHVWIHVCPLIITLFIPLSGTLGPRRLFPSKISPSFNIPNIPDLHPKVTYCFSEGSTVSYYTWLFIKINIFDIFLSINLLLLII